MIRAQSWRRRAPPNTCELLQPPCTLDTRAADRPSACSWTFSGPATTGRSDFGWSQTCEAAVTLSGGCGLWQVELQVRELVGWEGGRVKSWEGKCELCCQFLWRRCLQQLLLQSTHCAIVKLLESAIPPPPPPELEIQMLWCEPVLRSVFV